MARKSALALGVALELRQRAGAVFTRQMTRTFASPRISRAMLRPDGCTRGSILSCMTSRRCEPEPPRKGHRRCLPHAPVRSSGRPGHGRQAALRNGSNNHDVDMGMEGERFKRDQQIYFRERSRDAFARGRCFVPPRGGASPPEGREGGNSPPQRGEVDAVRSDSVRTRAGWGECLHCANIRPSPIP